MPSTPSFRAQQLAAMSEAFKSAPPDYQKVMMPHLFALLLDAEPRRHHQGDQELGSVPTPEEIEQQIKKAVGTLCSRRTLT